LFIKLSFSIMRGRGRPAAYPAPAKCQHSHRDPGAPARSGSDLAPVAVIFVENSLERNIDCSTVVATARPDSPSARSISDTGSDAGNRRSRHTFLKRSVRIVVATVLVAVAAHAAAQSSVPCKSVEDDRERLACYDRAAGRTPKTTSRAANADAPLPEDKATKVGDFVGGFNNADAGGSRLGFKWELDDDTRFGVLRFRTHKPNYLLPVSYNDRSNVTPYSPSLGSAPTADPREIEAKFQVSLKTKVVEGALNDRIDVWVAYTQQSNWQLYSPSAPFRETNYEPEIMTVLRTDWNALGLRMRFINFGFVHQSNGREAALSRSWNRLYAQFGFERGNFAMLVRPWYRIPDGESGSVRDNNPDIIDYLGHGDLLLFYHPEGSGQSFAALVRQNFDTGRGAVQFDWRFPLYRNLKGYLQIFNGYGGSLIDYNYRQSIFGVGLSLSDWM